MSPTEPAPARSATRAEAPEAEALPRLHAVTDDAVLARPDWPRVAVAVLEAGGAGLALHVRGPRTSGRRLFESVSALLPISHASGSHLFVNDRVDVAIAAGLGAPSRRGGVAGIHLGARSLAPASVRSLVGAGPWVGRSVHGPGEAVAAGGAGADYIFLGALFETPTHPGAPGMGLTGLENVTKSPGAPPVVGIGGIDPMSASGVLGAGGYGVAAIRGIWDAPDPAAAVQRYLHAMQRSDS